MKNILYLTFTIIALSSCSLLQRPQTFPTQEDKKFLSTINTMDSVILGDYFGKMNDVSGFTEPNFVNSLNKGSSEAKKQMREVYASLDTKEITGYPNTFIFCGFSKKYNIAFCDDALCERVEQAVRSNNSEIIKQLRSNIKPGECE